MISNLARSFASERKRRGLSLRASAEIVGVAFSSLSRFERGAGDASNMLKHKIGKWLTTGEGSPKSPRYPKEIGWAARIEQRLQLLEDRLNKLEAQEELLAKLDIAVKALTEITKHPEYQHELAERALARIKEKS